MRDYEAMQLRCYQVGMVECAADQWLLTSLQVSAEASQQCIRGCEACSQRCDQFGLWGHAACLSTAIWFELGAKNEVGSCIVQDGGLKLYSDVAHSVEACSCAANRQGYEML